MSDPASTVGIEDVLASVRRLVSTERPKPADLEAEPPAPEPVEALVLTADFRVTQDPPETETETEAEGSADVDGGATDTEVDTPAQVDVHLPFEDAAAEGSDAPGAAPADDGLPVLALTDPADAVDTPDGLAEAPAETATSVLSLEDRIAQLEAAVLAHTPQDFEPDGSEDLAEHRPESIPGVAGSDTAGSDGDLTDVELAARFAEEDLAENILDDVPPEAPAPAPKRGDATAVIDAYMARAAEAAVDAAETATDDVASAALETALDQGDPEPAGDGLSETAAAEEDAADPDHPHGAAEVAGPDMPEAEDDGAAAPKLDGVAWAREGVIAAALEEALTRVASETAAAAAAKSARMAVEEAQDDAPPLDPAEAQAAEPAVAEETPDSDGDQDAVTDEDMSPEEDAGAGDLAWAAPDATADDVGLELGHAPEAVRLVAVEAAAAPEDAGLDAFAPAPDPAAAEAPSDDESDEIDFDAWENIYARTEAEAAAETSDVAGPHRLFRAKPSLVTEDTADGDAAPGAEADAEADADDSWDDRIYHLESEDALGGLDFADETQEIDEDSLRDMVAEIVREELQGALGERITRNVRKLVRREIMRALSVREFD